MQSGHEKYRDILLDQDLKNKLKIKYNSLKTTIKSQVRK